MTTKEKILQTALQLFNGHGTDAITVRHIAKEMNISHGNLCYHFPNTDAIITGLYYQMVEQMNQQMASMSTTELTLAMVHEVSLQTFQVFYDYRFLMLDFVRIMRRIQEVKAHYQQLMQQRRQQFMWIVKALVASGLLKPEQFPGQFDAYLMQSFVFGDFWLSNAEILYEGKAEDKVRQYHRLYFDGLVPYLTEKGWEAYLVIKNG